MKGFRISIGWNLGRKKMSNHLLDPLTSVPINGTKIKETKKNKKKYIRKYKQFIFIQN